MSKLYKKYVRLSCRQASQLLVKQAEVPLTLSEWLRLLWHLRLCDPCTRFGRQVRLLDKLLTRNLTDETAQSAPAMRPERRKAMDEEIQKMLGLNSDE